MLKHVLQTLTVFSLFGCATAPDYDRVASSLLGQTVDQISYQLGSRPTFDLSFASTHSCSSSSPFPIRRMPTISATPPRKDKLCSSFNHPSYSQLPREVPLRVVTYDLGNITYYSTPTTATTSVVGNTAYTTINEGGDYAVDTTCTIELVAQKNVAVAYRLKGSGC